MLRNLKISTKILVVMLAIALGALLLIAVISYTEMLNLTRYSQDANIQLGVTASDQSREALLDQAEEYLGKIAQEQAKTSNAVLEKVASEISALVDYTEDVYANPGNFVGYDMPLPYDTTEGVNSAKYILAPGVEMTDAIRAELRTMSNLEYMYAAVLENDESFFNTYVGTVSGISYRYSEFADYDPTYEPRTRGWYTAAMARPGEIVWVDTYVDAYGELCVTCCSTFNGPGGQPAGVVATDITVQAITQAVLSTRIGEGGYAFLLDTDGNYIAHPRYEEPGFDTTPMDEAQGDWLIVLQDMSGGLSGVESALVDGVEHYVAYAPLESTGWSLGVTVPIDEVTLPARQTKAEIDSYTDQSQTYIRETLSDILMRFILLFAVCTMLFVVFAFVLSGTITRPIKQLVSSVKRMGGGDLDTAIEVKGKDEVAELAGAFNHMAADLKVYIRDLGDAIAEKERMGAELTVAANIQNDMLPRIFPTFADLPCLAIHAKMTPAKEVGGDFYDCFFLDQERTRLCAVIADVSGKGVPASLFMVIAKTLIKTHMLGGAAPARALAEVNDLLCEDNSSNMFVTAFVAVLDTKTGQMDYVNCGHNPPLLGRDGTFAYMKPHVALPLAVFPGTEYVDERVALEPGDALFLYTDGITEAADETGALFGEEALLRALNGAGTGVPEALDGAVRAAVAGFVGQAEQSDDMTTLAVTYVKRG